MKLFGEYLIEKGLIQRENLLSSLILQLRQTPPLAEVMQEKNLLTTEQILQILKLQTTEGSDFKSSAEKLNLWKPEFDQMLKLIMQEKRPTIGQTLYSQGYISLTDLTKALDEFVSAYSKEKQSPLESSPAAPMTLASPPSAEEVNPEYLHQFSDEKLNQLATKLKNSDFAEVNSLVKEFHILKGSARFCGAKMSELLWTQSALILEILTLAEDQFYKEAPNYIPHVLKTFEFLDSMRKSIQSAKSEFSGENSVSLQEQAQSHYNHLKELINNYPTQPGAVA